MNRTFSGKTVIVTGAGRGIGLEIARTFALSGANVVLAEKDATTGKEAEKAILQEGGKALFSPTDVRRPADIVQTVNQTMEAFGSIDVLINNAGVSRWADPLELCVEEWDDVLSTNLRGIFLFSREVARHMRDNGGGAIIQIASTRALMSEPNSEAYAASKGGILALTHAMAASFSNYSIRVNCISPGWIETGDYRKIRTEDHAQHPAGRVGRPEDIARACLFLADPLNDFISGENMVIDGGMTRKMIYLPD